MQNNVHICADFFSFFVRGSKSMESQSKCIIFLNIFYWLCYYSCPFFLLAISPKPCTHFSPSFSHLSSCPWVIHISSLASPFSILFLTSPCLFCTYHLCFLFPVSFSHILPIPLPAENPPCDLYFCYIPVLVVCLACFFFFLFRCGCWWLWLCCHFTVHSFHLFFLDKFL